MARCAVCPEADDKVCSGQFHRVICGAAKGRFKQPSGKHWQRIKTKPKAQAERFGDDEHSETRFFREELGADLDADLLDRIQVIANRFQNLPARIQGDFRHNVPGVYRKPRPERLWVVIYLVRKTTKLPWKSIAEALGLKVSYVRKSIPKGRLLIERAIEQGEFQNLM